MFGLPTWSVLASLALLVAKVLGEITWNWQRLLITILILLAAGGTSFVIALWIVLND
jgi:hypothetical protein